MSSHTNQNGIKQKTLRTNQCCRGCGKKKKPSFTADGNVIWFRPQKNSIETSEKGRAEDQRDRQ